MNKLLRSIFLILMAAVLALGAVSCQKIDGDGDESNTSETTAAGNSGDEVSLLQIISGDTCAGVVYSMSASAAEIQTAERLATSLSGLSGQKIKAKVEGVMPSDSKTVEFLIGLTKYKESESVYADLRYSQAMVKIIGNKIVIAGYDAQSYSRLLGNLILELEKAKKDDGLAIATDFSLIGSSNEILSALPILPGFSPNVTDTGDSCYMVTFDGAKKMEFVAYLQALRDDGFEEYASKTIESNEYYTFVKDKYVVNAMFSGKMRLLAESTDTTALPTKSEDNVYQAVSGVSTTITQIGIAHGDSAASVDFYNGMSYAIRLCDGSFIVIDGGHDKDEIATRLYEVLKKQSPSDDIVIAAWIFTHAHYDHVGAFQNFAKLYSDKVEVEKIITNIPGEDQRNGIGHERADVMSAKARYYTDTKLIKAHPGQVFNIRNAVITMLYTYDLNEGTLTDYNNTSLVFSVEAEGVKSIFMGDYSEQGKTVLLRYGNATLDCDIIQLAHHGFGGQSNNLYVTATPEYAFVPNGAYHVKYTDASSGKSADEDIRKKANNKYIFENLAESNIFLAADDITVLTLSGGNITSRVYGSVSEYIQA